jgi:dihydropteroate synthase
MIRRMCSKDVSFWPIPANRPAVMGILNVTPDSFSDGGTHDDPARALARAETMLAEGADIIDVGPESTRPGAEPISAGEQIDRAIPVIAALRSRHDQAWISLDTRLAEVAEAGLAAGARIINDVSALRDDAGMAEVIAKNRAGVVLMHMRGTPATMQQDPQYADVIGEVRAFLQERAEFAGSADIAGERIAIDPGIGFGKTVDAQPATVERFGPVGRVGLSIGGGCVAQALHSRARSASGSADKPAGRLTGLRRPSVSGSRRHRPRPRRRRHPPIARHARGDCNNSNLPAVVFVSENSFLGKEPRASARADDRNPDNPRSTRMARHTKRSPSRPLPSNRNKN